MSISDIRPNDCPADLVAKINHYAEMKKISWREAVISLAREVVSPKCVKTDCKDGRVF